MNVAETSYCPSYSQRSILTMWRMINPSCNASSVRSYPNYFIQNIACAFRGRFYDSKQSVPRFTISGGQVHAPAQCLWIPILGANRIHCMTGAYPCASFEFQPHRLLAPMVFKKTRHIILEPRVRPPHNGLPFIVAKSSPTLLILLATSSSYIRSSTNQTSKAAHFDAPWQFRKSTISSIAGLWTEALSNFANLQFDISKMW